MALIHHVLRPGKGLIQMVVRAISMVQGMVVRTRSLLAVKETVLEEASTRHWLAFLQGKQGAVLGCGMPAFRRTSWLPWPAVPSLWDATVTALGGTAGHRGPGR